MHNLDRRLTKVEELSDKLSEMAKTMQGMLSTLQYMQEEQKEQGERLKKIEDVPADNWNKLIYSILALIATAAVTWVLAKGGI